MSSISVYKLRIQEVTTALSNLNKVHKQGELASIHLISSQVHGPVQSSSVVQCMNSDCLTVQLDVFASHTHTK